MISEAATVGAKLRADTTVSFKTAFFFSTVLPLLFPEEKYTSSKNSSCAATVRTEASIIHMEANLIIVFINCFSSLLYN
jgi:hypothetical protein